ncbi:hypothetical protein STEG23_011073 [Scotinomys teguina]
MKTVNPTLTVAEPIPQIRLVTGRCQQGKNESGKPPNTIKSPLMLARSQLKISLEFQKRIWTFLTFGTVKNLRTS